jgi:drug/metabolite transporter (DMT)-like permease
MLRTDAQNSRPATAIGFGAILLWASLAVLTTFAGPVPPFQMTAMAFSLGFAIALCKWVARRERVARHLVLPVRVWALGVGGLFGYHACYFAALALAPPVEANLINYLWPLLIVVFSGLLPGERLRWWHLAGTFAGLAGCVLLVGGGAGGIEARYAGGYLAALAAALTWSGYSVLSRRVREVPTDAVGGFCGAPISSSSAPTSRRAANGRRSPRWGSVRSELRSICGTTASSAATSSRSARCRT